MLVGPGSAPEGAARLDVPDGATLDDTAHSLTCCSRPGRRWTVWSWPWAARSSGSPPGPT
ncbi:hypothetical protein NC658_32935 [Streptomyces griseoincarnatus]|uniref:Uncharacterized protein n=2 Tax=Streptomyces TaxID=1883 RepID=A0ABT0W343_STRGI|nr:hypothetical protein [Streptomyces griseoincarnatus]MBJ6613792.1 hypothetical protein [Streptomyces sp. I3(2020)]MCM2517994.1 hypothetical protein [Streptomyces griseoincarnatus]